MEISPRKPLKRTQEPIDEWLQNEGYFRKHAPRDPTCLFRAVSEQVYLTQHYHIRVRKECVEFMRKTKHLFSEGISIPFEDYLEQMICFTEWGGMTEIQAMSLLYKREFIIFSSQKQANHNVTNNGFKDIIYLCHTPQKQYESIYTKDFVANAAFCQSIVYQVLYKDVFQMANIEGTVHKMLHDRTATFRHDKFFLKGNLEIRDQLAAEIYNKIDNGTDEVDDARSVIKNIPPFPYRIAKALDPNIYRNTDFDIWHEIRREVKNAGWTRHNSHELQIGGKCLVQVDFNEEDFDKTNNNSIYVSSLGKDVNDNDTKILQKKSNDPIFYYGHIQEMGKSQGPVLVFIEELGEKRIVPYSALKPLPLKKNKQANWLPVCKKNLLLDSNQKWRKACSASSRKTKDSNMNILSNNNIDKNENNDNIVSDINENNFQWKEGSVKVDHQEYENYSMDKCANYSIDNSVEMFSTKMVLDNTQSSTIDIGRQESNKERNKEKDSFSHKNSENNCIRNSKSDSATNNDNNVTFNSYSKQKMQKDIYYAPYAGDSNAQIDHMLRSINCSVQKSIDVNGSDLPLSDPFTLRFFYNLGLEYFRGGANWNYLTNVQSPDFGQWYQGPSPNEEEITNITNMIQDCTLTQQKKEPNNDQKEIGTQSLYQENENRYVNDIKNTQIQKTEVQRGNDGKETSYSSRDNKLEYANKESSRLNRNGLGPRYKKNSENRHRSASHFSNQYSSNGSNSKLSKLDRDVKEDSMNVQPSQSIHQQLHTPANAMNTYQASYMQQGMYSGLPYYGNEAEAFANPYYSLNPSFIPIPCLSHSDIHDNNNVQPFSPHLCPGMDYAQAYSGLCPPYLCPPPTPYNIPPQNIPEHWYAVAGQPHYMQYAPVLSVPAETTCTGVVQNANQNVPS